MMSEERDRRNLSASRRPTTTCMLHENTGRGCIDCLAIDERDVTAGFYSGTNETDACACSSHGWKKAKTAPAPAHGIEAIYAVSSLGGGLAEYMLGPPYLVCMGSAASVAGLLSSYIAYKVVNRAFVGFGSEDLSWIGQLAAINIGMSLLVGGQIISMSHLGGLAGGAVAMMLFGPRYVRESGSVINRPILPWFR